MSTAPKIRERAIRFTDDEVRKLLEMPEVLLYKPIKLHQFHRSTTPGYDWQFRNKQGGWEDYREAELIAERCPYGKPGDRLWVQEAFRAIEDPGAEDCDVRRKYRDEDGETHYIVVDYKANAPTRIMDQIGKPEWKRSIHMPRWASRLTFEIDHVGVQSLCSEDLWALSLRRLEAPHGTL